MLVEGSNSPQEYSKYSTFGNLLWVGVVILVPSGEKKRNAIDMSDLLSHRGSGNPVMTDDWFHAS